MITERFLEWATTASVNKRIEAADALAQAYLYIDLNDEGHEGAEATLTLLLDDPSRSVRMAMARVFCSHDDAPRHIIHALSNDVDDIATLVLSQSPVFSDAELVDLSATRGERHQVAIASRAALSQSVTAAVAEVGCADACMELLMNPDVCLKRTMLRRIAERHGDHGRIRTSLLEREDLPGEIRAILTNRLAGVLGNFAASQNWMSEKRAAHVAKDSSERASILLAARAKEDELALMVEDLINDGKMTSAFLLRTICMGNIALFARAMARLSGLPHARFEHILSSGKSGAFKAAYDRAGLADRAWPVFHTALQIWRDMLKNADEADFSRLPFLVTREVLKTHDCGGDPVLDDLLVILRRYAAEAQRDKAMAKAREVARAMELAQMEDIYPELEQAIEDALVIEFSDLEMETVIDEVLEDASLLDLLDDHDSSILDDVVDDVAGEVADETEDNGYSLVGAAISSFDFDRAEIRKAA